MKVKNPPRVTNRDSIVKFIEADLWVWMKNLTVALSRLNFADNFLSFTVTNLKIPANTEVTISNGFQQSNNGLIPSNRIITRQTGNAVIVDGATPWDKMNVFLANPSANDAVVTVIFFI